MLARTHRRKLLRSLAASAGITLAMIALAPAMVAQAANANITVAHGTLGVNGSVALANPYGCVGKSTYPHISQHYPDRVSADGITTCSLSQPYEHVESWLYRQDCFLFICWWTQVGHDSNTTAWRDAVDHPNHTCSGTSNHRYRIESYHEVHGVDGKTYYGYTANEQNVNCG